MTPPTRQDADRLAAARYREGYSKALSDVHDRMMALIQRRWLFLGFYLSVDPVALGDALIDLSLELKKEQA